MAIEDVKDNEAHNARQQLAADMEQLASELQGHDPVAAQQLNELSHALREDRVGELTRLDLHAALGPQALEARILANAQKRPKLLGFLEVARNVVVLVPLVVTWASLADATSKYYQVLDKFPELRDWPFLYLWQGGFSQLGQPSRLTFTVTAWIDFGLLLMVVGIAAFVHWYRDYRVGTRAELQAAQLTSRVEGILWRLNRELAVQRYHQEIEAPLRIVEATEQFKTHANTLLDMFKAEQRQLGMIVRAQETGTNDLVAFGRLFQDATNGLLRYQEGIQATYGQLREGIDLLSRQIERTERQQDRLLRSLEAIGKQAQEVADQARHDRSEVVASLDKLQEQIRQSAVSAQTLASSTFRMQELGETLAQSKDMLLEAITRMSANTERVLSEHEQALATGYAAVQQAAQQLTAAVTGLAGQQKSLLGALQTSEERTADLLQRGAEAQEGLEKTVHSLAEATQETRKAAGSIGDALPRVSSAIDKLIGQQAELAKSLGDTQRVNQSLLESSSRDLQELYGKVTAAVERMERQVNHLGEKQEKLAEALERMNSSGKDLLENVRKTSEALTAAAERITKVDKERDSYVEEVRRVTEKLGQLIEDLVDNVSRTTQATHDRFGDLLQVGQRTAELGGALDRWLPKLDELIGKMSSGDGIDRQIVAELQAMSKRQERLLQAIDVASVTGPAEAESASGAPRKGDGRGLFGRFGKR